MSSFLKKPVGHARMKTLGVMDPILRSSMLPQSYIVIYLTVFGSLHLVKLCMKLKLIDCIICLIKAWGTIMYFVQCQLEHQKVMTLGSFTV